MIIPTCWRIGYKKPLEWLVIHRVQAQEEYNMKIIVFCLTVVVAVQCGYVSDLGLSPDELDFTPKDHQNEEIDFTPEEYKHISRGDHKSHGDDEDKKPPTSYSQFKLVSKNAVPIKFKVPAPKPKKPEWKPKPQWKPKPKKPMWKPAEPPAEWKPAPPAEWKPAPPAEWKPAAPPAEWKPSPPAEWKPKSKPKKPEWPQPPMSWEPEEEEEEEEEEEPALNTHPIPSPAPPAPPASWKPSPPSDSHGWQ